MGVGWCASGEEKGGKYEAFWMIVWLLMIEKLNIISNTGSRLALIRDCNFNDHLQYCNILCLMFSSIIFQSAINVRNMSQVMMLWWLVLVGVPPADMGRLRTWSGGRRRAKRRRTNVKTTIIFNKQENRKIDKYRTEKYKNKIKTKNLTRRGQGRNQSCLKK